MTHGNQPIPNSPGGRDVSNAEVKQLIYSHLKATRLSYQLQLALLIFAIAMVITYLVFSTRIETLVSTMEAWYLATFHPLITTDSVWVIPPLGFLGGLIASISPCIVILAPMTLGYLANMESESRRNALVNSLGFVLGVVLILCLFGLVNWFSGALVIEYRGHVMVLVGVLAFLMGLVLFGWLDLPVPEFVHKLPSQGNSFLVGVIFALVGSPCASPVLFSLLKITEGHGGQALTAMTMASYALGYTAILFIAGFLAGTSKRFGMLREYNSLFSQLSSILLMLMGGYYAWHGMCWFLN